MRLKSLDLVSSSNARTCILLKDKTGSQAKFRRKILMSVGSLKLFWLQTQSCQPQLFSKRHVSESKCTYLKKNQTCVIRNAIKVRISPSVQELKEISLGLVKTTSVQFSSVAQSCPTLCNSMNHSTPGLPVHYQLPQFTRTHVHRVGDATQPSHPLSSPSPPAPNPCQHQGLFQWVSSSHQVAKVLEFQLQHQSFQWTPRTDLL